MLSENLIKVNKKWRDEGLKLAATYLEEEIKEAFTNLGVLLADDAVQVYSTIGGFAEDDMDSECLTFWTVEKILRENDFNADKIYFADFLIESHRYYFKYKNAEKSEIHVSYDTEVVYKIANSFDGFLELYLTNIKGLFP